MNLLILASHNPEDHVLPHRFFQLLPANLNFGVKTIPLLNIDFGPRAFYFTNHLLMTLVAAGLCLLIMPRVARAYADMGSNLQAPRGLAGFFEPVLLFLRNNVVRPILNDRTDAFMPLLWTVFFFILFCNLLGMIPLDSIVYVLSGFKLQHVGGTATGNLAVTGGLAIVAFLAIHVSGVRAVYHGLLDGSYGHHEHPGHEEASPPADEEEQHRNHTRVHHDAQPYHAPTHEIPPGRAALLALPLYLWNFAPHVFKPDPHASPLAKAAMTLLDVVMWAVLLVLELLGAVIKPFALMIRLFANMIAGHIVLGSILSLTFVLGSYFVGIVATLGCVALSCLELFVAFLQAYIFAFLTTLFIAASVAPEH